MVAAPLTLRPLADVRILSIEQYGAGPWATLQLSDLGAEVIKIEDPASRGDIGRYVPPYQNGEDSLFFESLNRSKRSISLDLRNERGRKVFHDLVRSADAVFSNLRGDLPKRLGITYADLSEINPRIVCCSLSGFGQTGSRAALPGYDYLMQGLAGWMSITGEPDAPPAKSGLSLVDFGGGYVAALALVAGLWRARRDGVGCDCDVSLYETAISLLTYLATWTAAGYEPRRTASSAHQTLVPFQNFETADGWIVIACPKQKFWERLCDVLELPELLEDGRFADFAGRYEHRDELGTILSGRLRTRSSVEWVEALTAAGVPVAPVRDIAEALADPALVDRKVVFDVHHPVFGPVRHVRSAARVGDAPPPAERAPLRGEHTAALLEQLCGYTPEAIDELEAAGAFGAASPASTP